MSGGNFFAVDRTAFHYVSGEVDPALAYLVLARGTLVDNCTTTWGAKAVANYVGMRWYTANLSISRLQELGAVARIDGDTRARFSLVPMCGEDELEWIFLPNEIVTGAAGEPTPLALIREMQDPLLLRLFVDLYDAQNLPERGGIDWRVVRGLYRKKKLAEVREFTIWSFESEGMETTAEHPITAVHRISGKKPYRDFFARLAALRRLGLVHDVAHLIRGDEIFHVFGDSPDIENELRQLTSYATYEMLTGTGFEYRDVLTFPAYTKTGGNIELIDVARLRYLPHTEMTAAWRHNLERQIETFGPLYHRLISGEFGSSTPGRKSAIR
jgi:hypothetical protein